MTEPKISMEDAIQSALDQDSLGGGPTSKVFGTRRTAPPPPQPEPATLAKPYVVMELLRKAALYEERNKLYGDNYKRFGDIMKPLLNGQFIGTDPLTQNRFAVLVHIVTKLTRYCENFEKGGHADSLDDITVYAMMLKELDASNPDNMF